MTPKAFGWATKNKWRDKLGKVTDNVLAAKLGVTTTQVCLVRKALGIEPLRRHDRKDDRNRELLERFDAGDPPAALGIRFGITRERVRQILSQNRRDGAANRPNKTKAIPRHLLGTMTDGEIGRRFGICTPTVCSYRQLLGIAAFCKEAKPDTAKLIRMRAMLDRGMSYAAIGRAVGCRTLNPSAFARNYLLKWKDWDLTVGKRTGT